MLMNDHHHPKHDRKDTIAFVVAFAVAITLILLIIFKGNNV